LDGKGAAAWEREGWLLKGMGRRADVWEREGAARVWRGEVAPMPLMRDRWLTKSSLTCAPVQANECKNAIIYLRYSHPWLQTTTRTEHKRKTKDLTSFHNSGYHSLGGHQALKVVHPIK
jgi:hypothetical protein